MVEVQSAPHSPHSVTCPQCGSELPLPGRPLWFVYRVVGETFWMPSALAQEE
jgi:hypothetical protein